MNADEEAIGDSTLQRGGGSERHPEKKDAIAPPRWVGRESVKSIWVRGFRAVDVGGHQLISPIVFDLGEVRVQIFAGTGRYVRASNGFDPGALLNTTLEVLDLPEGSYTFLIAPHDDASANAEGVARQALNTAEALLAAFNSRKIVYERIFENLVDPKKNTATIVTDAILNPAHLRVPDLSAASIDQLARIHAALGACDTQIQRRVNRAFRWLAAAHDDRGVDRFIKAWMALECLAPGKEKSINAALARTYSGTIPSVGMEFFVGRLHNARSTVVHHGVDVGVNGVVDDYMDALFVDVLHDLLSMPSVGRARSVLERGRDSIEEALRRIQAAEPTR